MSDTRVNSVIMIAYHYPPEGAAGVHRPLRFVRHLPTLGWRPIVISCDKPSYERYDPSLLELMPSGTEVHRVRAWDPWQAIQARRAHRGEPTHGERLVASHNGAQAPLLSRARAVVRGMVRKAEAWLYHPDLSMPWIRPAVEETVRACARARAGAIWATAGPVSAFSVAFRASQRTGVPYVLDFRDAWTITYNAFDARRPAWAIRRDRQAMARMLNGARAVVFRYAAEAECYWRAYPGVFSASNVHIIPNGFDGEIDTTPPLPGERCRILYTGTLISYRYNTLLESLRELKRRDPARAERLSFLFVGEGGEALRERVAALELSGQIEIRGPVSHAETRRLQHDADALLVLGRHSTLKGYELFASAKVFEYLKVGRPILGLLPSDETRNVLDRVGVSTVADIASTSDVCGVLERIVDAWHSGALQSLLPNRAACQAYSAEYQTAAVARALEGALAADPFVPGSVQIPPSLRADVERANLIRRGADSGRVLPSKESSRNEPTAI